jgi:MFS family permease
MPQEADSRSTASAVPAAPVRTIFGAHPMKWVFAVEYVMQGLANPFQGITYQPFFRHFRIDYGLSEAATQNLFSRSYLAWSFKPLLGFLMDAYGRTKIVLIGLLLGAIAFYLLTPLFDINAAVFFGLMFSLSIVLAATDVAVDRATVIAGDEEARETGRSKATTVGLNQAICWAAIYGTGILAAVWGGWVADHVETSTLLPLLAIVPAALLLFVLRLPRDRAVPIPLKASVLNFWQGLNTGPILWVMAFYFLFHFQPAMGALWTNYMLEDLGFTQTRLGFVDGASNLGFFLGVLLFAWRGVRWQDAVGLRRIFKLFIVVSIAVNLSQYLLVDPWFTGITDALGRALPFIERDLLRTGFMAGYNLVLAVFVGLIRMSTFSLVGAVIPVAAAGSLFAGFMSVSNLAYSFSYASGSWLYENGLAYGWVRHLQETLFAVPAAAGDTLSISMLILAGSAAYLLSFLAAHRLPDRRETLQTATGDGSRPGPERWRILGGTKRTVDGLALAFFAALVLGAWRGMGFDPIAAVMLGFFATTFVRMLVLDGLLGRRA